MTMTAATPMTIPRIVRNERMTLRRRSPQRKQQKRIPKPSGLPVYHCNHGSLTRPSTKRTIGFCIGGRAAGSWVTITMVIPRSRRLPLREKLHDFAAARAVDVRRFIGEQNMRRSHDGTGDGHPLLPAGAPLGV